MTRNQFRLLLFVSFVKRNVIRISGLLYDVRYREWFSAFLSPQKFSLFSSFLGGEDLGEFLSLIIESR